MSARYIAAAIFEACNEDCDAFELWEDAYRIDAQLPVTADTLTALRQGRVVATEEALLGSIWVTGQSRHCWRVSTH